MDNTEYEIQQLKNELSYLRSDVGKINMALDNINLTTINQQNNIATIVQYINMQSIAINEANQTLSKIFNKISDMEIKNADVEDSVDNISQEQKGTSADMQEIKSSVETIKYYLQSMIGGRN